MTETTKQNELSAAITDIVSQLKSHIADSFEERDALEAERVRKTANALLDERVEEIRKANPSFTLPGVEFDADGKKESFSISRACLAIATKDWGYAPYEKEVFDEMRRKDLTLGTGSAGGYTVPENYIADVVEYLYNNTAAFKLGAQRMDVERGSPIHIPKLTGSATGYWIANEGDTITESSETFGQIELTPHTLAAYVVLSNTLLENGSPVADQIVSGDLQRRLGVSMDAAILNGSGASGQPTGMLQAAGINTHDFGTDTATYNHLAGMINELAKDNALMGKLGWVWNPAVMHNIRTMLDATNQPLERRVISDSAPDRVMGYAFETTNQMPATENAVMLANWSEVFVPVWKALELRASDTAKDAFEKDQLHVRAIMRCDVGIRHPESICASLNYAA